MKIILLFIFALQVLGCTNRNPSNETIASASKAANVNPIKQEPAKVGSKEILGIDLSLSPDQMLEKYKDRGVEKCYSQVDTFQCINVGAPENLANNSKIKIHFFKNEALELNLEPKKILFDPILTEAVEKYQQEAKVGWMLSSPFGESPSKFCVFSFDVSGGVLNLMTQSGLYGADNGELACTQFRSAKSASERANIQIDFISWSSAKVDAKRAKYYEDEKQKKAEEQSKKPSGL
jgi:hypothetical protein